jgi:hypothetical protein
LRLCHPSDITSSVTAVQTTLTLMTDECVSSIERGLAAMAAGDLTVEAHAQTPRIVTYGSDQVGRTAQVTNAALDEMESTASRPPFLACPRR